MTRVAGADQAPLVMLREIARGRVVMTAKIRSYATPYLRVEDNGDRPRLFPHHHQDLIEALVSAGLVLMGESGNYRDGALRFRAVRMALTKDGEQAVQAEDFRAVRDRVRRARAAG